MSRVRTRSAAWLAIYFLPAVAAAPPAFAMPLISGKPVPAQQGARAPTASAGAAQSAAITGPSIEDTKAFIIEKIKKRGSSRIEGEGHHHPDLVQNISFEGCKEYLEEIYTYNGVGDYGEDYIDNHTCVIDLSSVTKITLAADREGAFLLDMRDDNNIKETHIHTMDYTTKRPKVDTSTKQIDDVSILLRDHESLESLSKAFAHIISICSVRRKKELF